MLAGITQVRAGAAVDDLAVLLPDWRTHLRARNVAPSTIASYLKVGDNLVTWLHEAGMPTTASGIAREHLEAFLAALADRVSPVGADTASAGVRYLVMLVEGSDG